jgi:uncharacterized protein DUF4124
VYAKQMRLIVSTFLIFFMCCLSAETVYKTVDEDGNIIFTDKPSEEAEEIKIQELETIKNPNPGRYKPSTEKPPEEFKYKSFVITSPENGAGIRSNNGNVSISVSLEPMKKAGHKIIISMDGKEVGSGSSVSLQNVDRGTHSISASVVDANGKTWISTSSTFSMLRVSQ